MAAKRTFANINSSSSLEQEYRAYLASLPNPCAIFLNRKLVDKNALFMALFPWTKNENPSLSTFFGKRNADLLRHIAAMLENPERGCSIQNCEVLIPAPGRKTVAAEVTVTLIPYSGQTALFCTFVDVSARRKVLEQAALVEKKFQSLLDGSPDGLSVTKNGTILVVNDAFARMFGFSSPMELLGKKLTTTVWGRNARKELLDVERRLIDGNTPTLRHEYTGLTQGGKKLVIEAQSSRIPYDGKDAVLTYHRDITAQRHAEEEFHRKLKGFELLDRFIDEPGSSVREIYHRGMNAAMRGLDFEAAAVFIVEGELLVLKDHHGFGEVIRTKLSSQHLDEGFARFFNKTHETLYTSVADYPPHLPFKSLFASEAYASLAFLPVLVQKDFHGILLLASKNSPSLDVHDRLLLESLRKHMGNALHQVILRDQAVAVEQRFHTTVASLAEVLYTVLPNGSFVYLSMNVEKLTGYRPADFSQNPNLWRTLLHPDDRPILSQRISQQTTGKDEFQLEYRVLPKGKATYIWLRDSVRYQRDEERKVVAIHGILWDITAEKCLAQRTAPATEDASLSRLQFDILDSLPEGIALLDENLECVEWNAALARITGVASADAIGKNVRDLPLIGEVSHRLAEGLAGRAHECREEIQRTDDKKIRYFTVRALARANPEGTRTGTLLLVNETTFAVERQLAQQLQWKNKHIELLNRILSVSHARTDLPSTFKTIADELRVLIPYDGISIAFLDDDQKLTPWYAAVHSTSGESIQAGYLPLDVAVIYDAVRTGSPAIKESGREGEILSQISSPLFVDEKAIGAVSLVSYREHAFGHEERALLQPVAEHIGAIIERVRLFEQARDESAYIHNLLNSINQIVFTVDRHYRITHVNKAWKEFMMRQRREMWADEGRILGQSLEVIMPDAATWGQYKSVMDDLFSRRIEHYERDVQFSQNGEQATHHLVINPMVIHERVIGLVFTQTDITEINRTEAEIKRRNRELVALNAIATSITKSLDLDEILRVATDQIRESFDASVVGFYLRTEEESLILARSSGLTDELASVVRRVEAASSLDTLFGSYRVPRYVQPGEGSDEPLLRVAKSVSSELGLVSCALVPLQSKEKLPGAILIGFAKHHPFSEREQQLLILIGNQVGAAIENAQLYGEIQHQVQTLTTLYELGKGLTGVLDLNSMLQVLYREVSKALPLERFYYQAYSPQDNTLSLLSRTVKGVAEFYPAGVKVRSLTDWPNTIYQNVVESGRSYVGSTSEAAHDSMIAVPIKSDEKVVGIISIASSLPNLYTAGHLRLLESIANLAGVAIGKAMLYEDTLRKTAEIEDRNKELDDFTYVVSHDLKEPLISIEGYSKIVMKDYHDRLDREGKEYLAAVVQSTARMKHLIDDLLTLSRLGRMLEAPETVSVRRIVDEILHDFQFSLRERHVVVNVQEHLPVVRYSSIRLSMVFRNLISNAMKFNDKPVPVIAIGCDETEEDYQFWVKDNGIGIEPQYFDRIFTIFQRLKRSEEYRGTGAGLTIVKKIVEREGGRIWLDSVPGVGSTFYFTIKKTS